MVGIRVRRRSGQSGSLTYRVFQREYDRALVLYKPLSYATGKGTGGTGR